MDEYTRRIGCTGIRSQDHRYPLHLNALTGYRDVVKPPSYGAPSRLRRGGERLAYETAPAVGVFTRSPLRECR